MAPIRNHRQSSLSQKKQSSTTSLPASLRSELGLEEPKDGKWIEKEGSKIDEEGRRNAKRDRAFYFSQKNRLKDGKKNSTITKKPLGRKEARKAQRQEKKISRSQHYHVKVDNSKKDVVEPRQNLPSNEKPFVTRREPEITSTPMLKNKGKRKAEDEDKDEEKSKSSQRSKTQKKHVQENVATPLQRLLQKQGGSISVPSEELEGPSKSKSKRNTKKTGLSSLDQQEDDEIAWLEANLGLKNGKKKKSSTNADEPDELDDGLDDFMDDLDRFYPGMYDDEDDEGSDLSIEEDEESDQYSQEEEESDEEQSKNEESESEEDDIDVEGLPDYEADSIQSVSEQESAEIAVDEQAREGRKEDTTAQTAGKYVPPALRRKMEQEQGSSTISLEEQKLQRSIKGLLNRFGENNLEIIIGEIEALYRQSSRAHVTNHLTKLVLETIATNENIGDSLVVLYATLISSLHRIVGVEFGAYFIQELIDQFLKEYEIANAAQSQEESIAAKQAGNLSALLSSLYNLNVIACPLVYDVIRLFLGVKSQEKHVKGKMSELDVNLLLKMVKLSGAQLRHDDPTSLKSIVQIAQEQQQKQIQQGESISMRAKFMIESLSDLRNNRSRATTANAGAETLTKMRKFLGNLSKKHTIRTFEPLRVGLDDLKNVEKRGKWWLVGAAWAGYDFSTSKENEKDSMNKVKSNKKESAKKGGNDDNENQEEKLMKLAREHGMNTVIRQQIFVSLLSSQDYLDAVQRLLSLTHKKPNQRREIIRVLLHCLTHENTFNPYYVVVGSRIVSEDERGTRITMQYCLWDYMRKLGEKDVGGQTILNRQGDGEESEEEDALEFEGEDESSNRHGTSQEAITNVARAYGWWIAKGSLTLDCLRAVDFTTIRKSIPFLQLLIVFILLSIQSSSPVHTLLSGQQSMSSSRIQNAVEVIFVQGTRSNQRLAQGILIFMEQHLAKKDCRSLAIKLGLSGEMTSSLLQSRSTALETVRVGARMAANDDLD